MKNYLLILTGAIILAGCNSPKQRGDGRETNSFPSFKLTEVWRTDNQLLTCESVLYDESRELLFVSCINGTPTDKDGNGFVSKVDTDGTINTLDWVTGLDAPKGMGIFEGRLYVTNIDELVIIDIEKGTISNRIPVEGASFLNDISVDSDGTVYFSGSDSGIIWIYRNGEVKRWITEGLKRPNGLYVEKDRVLLTSSGSQDLRIIDKSTGKMEVVTTGIGAGDGIEFTGDRGYYIASSWTGEVFLIYPDYSKVSLLKTSDREINSADIGFNRRDRIVYIPTFFDNRVVAYRLEESED